MSTRKQFLTTVAAGTAAAAAPIAASPDVSTPKPPQTPAPASPAARAWAERMRAFDATLGDAQIESIARGIDDSYGLGKRLNPKGRLLRNGDGPVPPFGVE